MLTELVVTVKPITVPEPRYAISIRPGTLADVPFIDSLQKQRSRQVGFFPTKAIEGKIALGHVLVAEEVGSRQYAVGSEDTVGEEVGSRQYAVGSEDTASDSPPTAYCLPPTPVGYLIGNDQYFKRDDLGIIYQINVVEGKQRGLIGASLLKAQFERSAYGCRLYCCWCAQDLEANHFWESMGFVPLAFRTGSRTRGGRASEVAGRQDTEVVVGIVPMTHNPRPTPAGSARVHIFWQRRIRAGDCSTPYWFPSQTTSGSIREDRLVFPIPPGVHWKDPMPVVLPGDAERPGQETPAPVLPAARSAGAAKRGKATTKPRLGFLWFAGDERMKPGKRTRGKPARQKHDAKLVAAARELRDRWQEHTALHPGALEAHGKYDVSRRIEAGKRSGAVRALAA